jgi:hypothetical protein
MKKILSLLILPFCVIGASGEVTLSLLNSIDGTPLVGVDQGGTFSLTWRVSGLTSPGLDFFDAQLAALPAGISLVSFASNLPSGWLDFGNEGSLHFAGVNFSGPEITGTHDLLTANFSVDLSAVQGTYGIAFVAENSATMELRDVNGSSIPYTPSGASISIIPEPTTVYLGALGAVFLSCLLRRRRGAGASRQDESIGQN